MKCVIVTVAGLLGMADIAAAQPVFEQYDSPIPEERTLNTRPGDKYGGLPPGVGREEVYYAFDACLKLNWIRNQRFTRTQWDMAVDKLAMDCKLGDLDPGEKEIMVNYLTRNFGRSSGHAR